ncbi:MAG: YHS domain-containing (seleno)protein [Paracoccaceae bacterium]
MAPPINRRLILATAIAAPFAAVLPNLAMATSPPVFNKDGLAINGYDPVGYFDQGEAVEGSDAHMLKWMGSMWRFASAQNMATFESDPRAFAPRYGGYCAFAMAKGAIARSVPTAWTVHENKLYLNQSKIVRALWKRNIPEFVRDADMHWPGILDT